MFELHYSVDLNKLNDDDDDDKSTGISDTESHSSYLVCVSRLEVVKCLHNFRLRADITHVCLF